MFAFSFLQVFFHPVIDLEGSPLHFLSFSPPWFVSSSPHTTPSPEAISLKEAFSFLPFRLNTAQRRLGPQSPPFIRPSLNLKYLLPPLIGVSAPSRKNGLNICLVSKTICVFSLHLHIDKMSFIPGVLGFGWFFFWGGFGGASRVFPSPGQFFPSKYRDSQPISPSRLGCVPSSSPFSIFFSTPPVASV